MKKLAYILFLPFLLYSCTNDGGLLGSAEDENLGALSNVADIAATPRVGGAVVHWSVPEDSSFTYIEIRYQKNGKQIVKQASRYTDSLVIEGLIHKEPTAFEIQTVKETKEDIERGEIVTIDPVTPIKRSPEVTFFPDELTKVEVTADMLDTFTQEESEGPKENLVDGDKDTYWHSAWSSGVEPLPHWIQVNFESPQELGAFKYWFRQGGGEKDRPNHWAVETSEDGENWERVWESKDSLSTSDKEQSQDMGENYEALHFRFMILEVKGGDQNFTNLGEISFYSMKSDIVDKEKEAEEEYYNY